MFKYYAIISVLVLIGFSAGIAYLKSPTTKKVITNEEWNHIDSIRDRVEQEPFEIDFKAMNAVCIKRTFNDGNYCTYIMYKNKDSTLSQQYFTCSEEKHKQLVEQFKRQIGSF